MSSRNVYWVTKAMSSRAQLDWAYEFPDRTGPDTQIYIPNNRISSQFIKLKLLLFKKSKQTKKDWIWNFLFLFFFIISKSFKNPASGKKTSRFRTSGQDVMFGRALISRMLDKYFRSKAFVKKWECCFRKHFICKCSPFKRAFTTYEGAIIDCSSYVCASYQVSFPIWSWLNLFRDGVAE